MRIVFANTKTREFCTSLKAATKLFGGNKLLAKSLLARLNALENADVIKDIIVMKPFRFHALQGNRSGQFAIDVKTKRDKWRIVLEPLDENYNQFKPCNIDELATVVKTVMIKEVSAHYE